MEIYTRGVDRFFSPQAPPFSFASGVDRLVGYLVEKIAFDGADGLWESFQEGILEYVTDPTRGGEAVINVPIKNRPKVGDALKALLKQSGPINYVPCGN